MPVYNLTVKAGNISKSFNQIADTKEEALAKVKLIARLDPQFRNARVEFPTLAQISTVSLTEDPKFLGPTGIGQTAGTPFDPDVAFRSIVEEEQPFATSTPGDIVVTDMPVDMPMLIGDKGDGDAGDEPVDMLPPFWQERYNEYLQLSPYLQRVILENQIKDYIELEPYRGEGIDGGASIENLFDREPGSVADIALESVFDPTKGGVGGENFEVQPPAGFVPPSRIPDPLQLQGYANTGLQDILNIFYANPDRYISEIPLFEDVYDPDIGQFTQRQVGTQQVLSPVAQAALQAFSTQRGAESADIASRYGTASPFGVIAGAGGETAAEKAIELANLQAKAGITNPFAALGIGSAIGDISTILRGGITAEQQQQQQLLAALSPLLQASPGTLGGLSRVLGGEEQLRNLFSPFTSPAVQPVTDQGAPIQVSQQPFAPIQKTGEFIAPQPMPYFPGENIGPQLDAVVNFSSQQVSEVPFAMQAPRQTVGGYQRADLFERGGIKAEAGIAGEEIDRYLGQVTPFGQGVSRGSLGAQLA